MVIPDSRPLYIASFLGCVALMATALFFQHVMELEPCPLCMTQRIVVIAIGIASLAAALHNPASKGKRRYGALIVLLGLCGAGLAIRQLYLQSLPAGQAPACMPPLEFLVDALPFTELISVMLSGTGDCAEVQWEFLGLTIPGWTLVCFMVFSGFGLFEMVRKHHLYR